jgi:hypothetical protein
MTQNQQQLDKYFSTIWKQRNRNLDQYTHTGWALADKIQPGESVVDVGCGDNPFREIIPNLIGFDPAFVEADAQLTLEQFTLSNHQIFDVALCLGSINFGDRENIERQIGLVVGMLSAQGRIYWRCNPGSQDHGNVECESIIFYPWSIPEHVRLADKFGFDLVDCCWDTGNRIYAHWQRRQC